MREHVLRSAAECSKQSCHYCLKSSLFDQEEGDLQRDQSAEEPSCCRLGLPGVT